MKACAGCGRMIVPLLSRAPLLREANGTPHCGLETTSATGRRWPAASQLLRALGCPAFRSSAPTSAATPPQEPWSYGAAHEAINRRAIELRYELLPYIYNVMRGASVTGLPALRPMFLEFPEDPLTYDLGAQFMFGDALLVAPVIEEGA